MHNALVSVKSHVNPHTFHIELSAMHRVASSSSLLTDKSEQSCAYRSMFFSTQQRYLDSLRSSIAPYTNHVPRDAGRFIEWMASLAHIGPGQQHVVLERIAHEADFPQVNHFAAQQVSAAYKFKLCSDDAKNKIALLISPEAASLFDIKGSHSFHSMKKLLSDFTINGPAAKCFPKRGGGLRWETVALENMELAFMTSSKYAYQQVGSVMAERVCTPLRISKIMTGLARTSGIGRLADTIVNIGRRENFLMLDWAKQFLGPLMARNPALCLYLAEGALMRLLCVERCMDRYDHELDASQVLMQNYREMVITGRP
jgi:hypothetical protein